METLMFITAPLPVRFFFTVAMLLAAGCASMMQKIPLTSSPPHAALTLPCAAWGRQTPPAPPRPPPPAIPPAGAGGEPRHAGYTPATIALRRDADGCEITNSKLGHRQEAILFRRARSEGPALH